MPETTNALATSIVVPAYNEAAGVASVVSQIETAFQDSHISFEILVVDDGSTDHTADAARQTSATVIACSENRGYGASLKVGIGHVQHELVCIIDADGTYPADRLPELVSLCQDQDMVIGARDPHAVNIPWVRRPAKWLLTALAGYLTGTKIPDLNSGLRVMRRSFLANYLDIVPDGFSFTTTITLAGLSDGARLKFVPIDYHDRIGRSKIRPRDVFGFLMLIIRTMTYFRPLRVFLPLALILLAGAAVKLGIDIFRYDNIEDTSVILFLAGVQTLFVGMLADLMCIVRRRTTNVSAPQPQHAVRSATTDATSPSPPEHQRRAESGNPL
jgi:glycosyltransferase involved in cell wall biosynthesis